MLDLLLRDSQRHWTGVLAVLALLVTAVLTVATPVSTRIVALGGLFGGTDGAGVESLTLLTVAMVFVYSTDYLRRRAILKGEYYVLGLFATLGGMVLDLGRQPASPCISVSSCMSLCLYALVAFDRESGIAAESAMKYFVLGAMASGTLLYGMSIVYGVTGSLELADIAIAVQAGLGAEHRPAVRARVPDRRHRLQVRRGAVPHVDAGCVRGLRRRA